MMMNNGIFEIYLNENSNEKIKLFKFGNFQQNYPSLKNQKELILEQKRTIVFTSLGLSKIKSVETKKSFNNEKVLFPSSIRK